MVSSVFHKHPSTTAMTVNNDYYNAVNSFSVCYLKQLEMKFENQKYFRISLIIILINYYTGIISIIVTH